MTAPTAAPTTKITNLDITIDNTSSASAPTAATTNVVATVAPKASASNQHRPKPATSTVSRSDLAPAKHRTRPTTSRANSDSCAPSLDARLAPVRPISPRLRYRDAHADERVCGLQFISSVSAPTGWKPPVRLDAVAWSAG